MWKKLNEYVFPIVCALIGVFITLLADKFKDYQRAEALEKNCLSSLFLDTSNDIKRLKGNISLLDEMAASIDSMMLMKESATFNTNKFYKFTYSLIAVSSFIPNTNTYDEMIATSQISSISNDSIRSSITGLYPFYKDLQIDDESNRQQQTNCYMSYMAENIDQEAWEWASRGEIIPDNHPFAAYASKALFDKKFRNQLMNLQSTLKQCRRQYYEAFEKCTATNYMILRMEK